MAVEWIAWLIQRMRTLVLEYTICEDLSSQLPSNIDLYLFWFYNHSFSKFRKTLKVYFLETKLDFQKTKLSLSNSKFPSILGLTFPVLKPSKKPSNLNFLSKNESLKHFSTFKNYIFILKQNVFIVYRIKICYIVKQCFHKYKIQLYYYILLIILYKFLFKIVSFMQFRFLCFVLNRINKKYYSIYFDNDKILHLLYSYILFSY